MKHFHFFSTILQKSKAFIILNFCMLFLLSCSLTLPLVKIKDQHPLGILITPTSTRAIIHKPILIPSKTPTPTNTLKPSPTYTPTATYTPTLINTYTPPPSLTPLNLIYSKRYYVLDSWSYAEAKEKIHLLENYKAFLPAALLAQELTLLYPKESTPELEAKKALYLAKINHPLASNFYANLISMLLNNKVTSALELSGWLQSRQSELFFNTFIIHSPEGMEKAYLLQISKGGNGLFWILYKNQKYHVIPLLAEFDFSSEVNSTLLFDDINQDSIPEIIITTINKTKPQNLPLPLIFDLSKMPYIKITAKDHIRIPIGIPYNGKWEVQKDNGRNILLVFHGSAFPPCPVKITSKFSVNHSQLELIHTDYQVNPAMGYQGYCSLILDHAQSVWGLDAFITIAENLLPLWPPPPLPNGELFPLNAKDELMFRLGISYALKNNPTKAKEYLIPLTSAPPEVINPYVETSKIFLQTYTKPEDIYKSCIALISASHSSPILQPQRPCDPRFALQALFSYFQPTNKGKPHQEIINFLVTSGVPIRSSGYKDFDNDSKEETWLIISHYKSMRLELWIYHPNTQQLLFISSTDNAFPNFVEFTPVQDPPVFEVDHNYSFQIIYYPQDNFAQALLLRKDYFWNGYVTDIFNQITTQYLTTNKITLNHFPIISTHSKFVCTKEQEECAEFFALRGLAHETDNQEPNAIDDYYHTLINYPNTPFHYYVRVKLALILTPTSPSVITQTATHTPSPTLTLTPTREPTETPTITETPTPIEAE